MTKEKKIISIHVWDRSVRVFHWLNLLFVLGLIILGVIILNGKAIGISSDGKILLKTIHVYIGYLFVINLLWRILWGFLGSKSARWSSILPFQKGYWQSLTAYFSGFKNKQASFNAGHNPLGKLMIFMFVLSLCTQAITGLVLAGTDLYMPPIGQEITEWIAEPTSQINEKVSLKPGSMEGINPQKYDDMRAFRKVFIDTHEITFYLLVLLIFMHITGVVIAEIRDKNGLVSAMITGEKVFKSKSDDDQGNKH